MHPIVFAIWTQLPLDRISHPLGFISSVQILLTSKLCGIAGFAPTSYKQPLIPSTHLSSELLMCRKIGCNKNFRNRVNKTEFGRIVLNLIFYFGSKTKVKGVDITFF
jgi:hypothetical protein